MTPLSPPNPEAKFWNKVADKYAASPVKDEAAFARKQQLTREYAGANATVLELGCGTGSLALKLAPAVGHIHAMDISEEMIRIARDKKADQQTENVTFHVGTLETATGFEAAQFDSAWAYSILHLVGDRRGTLEQLFELLKPGGTLISSNVCLGGTWIPYSAIIGVMRWFGQAPSVYVYDKATIVRELGEVGFVDIKVHDVGADANVAFVTATKPR